MSSCSVHLRRSYRIRKHDWCLTGRQLVDIDEAAMEKVVVERVFVIKRKTNRRIEQHGLLLADR